MRTIVGLVLVLTFIIAVGVVLIRRRDRDEIHTIDTYRNALSTLDDMQDPSARTVRILSEDEARQLRQPHPSTVIRSQPRREPSLAPLAAAPLVFDENGDVVPPEDHAHQGGHPHHDDPRWALDRMQNRHVLHNRELAAALGALAVLVILIVIGILLGNSSGTSTHHARTTTASTTQPTHTPRTTTTLPTAFTPQPGASASSATYYVPGAYFHGVVTATSGACWTTITAVDGSVLFNGTIAAGASQSVQRAGGFNISLGAPGNVTITVNGIKVVFPTGYSAPLSLSFISPPGTSTTTIAGTTTTTVASSTTKTP